MSSMSETADSVSLNMDTQQSRICTEQGDLEDQRSQQHKPHVHRMPCKFVTLHDLKRAQKTQAGLKAVLCCSLAQLSRKSPRTPVCATIWAHHLLSHDMMPVLANIHELSYHLCWVSSDQHILGHRLQHHGPCCHARPSTHEDVACAGTSPCHRPVTPQDLAAWLLPDSFDRCLQQSQHGLHEERESPTMVALTPICTWLPILGWRSPRSFPVPPSVTCCMMVT